MRKYRIEAALLDLEDPIRVIGCLREPLPSPEANDRDGFVPNVVYGRCSLLHGNALTPSHAMSDTATAVGSIVLDALLAALG